jgi:hypothetical protein
MAVRGRRQRLAVLFVVLAADFPVTIGGICNAKKLGFESDGFRICSAVSVMIGIEEYLSFDVTPSVGGLPVRCGVAATCRIGLSLRHCGSVEASLLLRHRNIIGLALIYVSAMPAEPKDPERMGEKSKSPSTNCVTWWTN